MKTPELIWKKFEAKNVIVAQSDGTEIEGLMVIARILKKQSQNQLIGANLIDHMMVNGEKFFRLTYDVFTSSAGEPITIRRHA